jgi:predicted metal-dependent hydrolase
MQGETIVLTYKDSDPDKILHFLYKHLDRYLLEEAKPYAEKYQDMLRDYGYTEIPSFKARIMKSKWGVCYTKKNSITISSYLIHYPLYCLEYIMVHEMTHFIVPNHSKRFYEVVVNNMPDYKRAVKRLKL